MVLLEKCCTAAGFTGGYAGRSAAYPSAVQNRTEFCPVGYKDVNWNGSAAAQNGLSGCGGYDPSLVDGMPLTMGYVPRQSWINTYDSATALCRGTLFPELEKPFKGYRGEGK